MRIWGEKKLRAVVDVLCDRCKKSCKEHIANDVEGNPLSHLIYATLEARWPYGSPKDTEHHQLNLCEPCYDWLRDLLKKHDVEIRVADGDIWTGQSTFD